MQRHPAPAEDGGDERELPATKGQCDSRNQERNRKAEKEPVNPIGGHGAIPVEIGRRQGKAGFRNDRRDLVHLGERNRLVIGRAAIAGEADDLERVPAEQAPQETRAQP